MFELNSISCDLSKVSVQLMNVNGYWARLMEAERLIGNNEFGLPSGIPLSVIPIECLPGIPSEWVCEKGSYVVPITSGKGLWFDWTMNDESTAVLPSVKGMNPITGMKIDSLRMEQYREKCPIHNHKLMNNNHCEKCGYDFAWQNYVSYPNRLWWDGFRQPDGSVRQFFFTDEDRRDVASAVIGKENTVPAFGFAFFKTRKERFIEKTIIRGINSNPYLSMKKMGNNYPVWIDTSSGTAGTDMCLITNTTSNVYYSAISLDGELKSSANSSGTASYTCSVNTKSATRSIAPQSIERTKLAMKSRDVSVGAGAKINQNLEIDKLPLTEYFDEEQALIRLYFVFENQLEGIIRSGGVKKIEQKQEGYLADKVEVG